MVGILLSFWETLFSSAMLVSGRVDGVAFPYKLHHIQQRFGKSGSLKHRNRVSAQVFRKEKFVSTVGGSFNPFQKNMRKSNGG